MVLGFNLFKSKVFNLFQFIGAAIIF